MMPLLLGDSFRQLAEYVAAYQAQFAALTLEACHSSWWGNPGLPGEPLAPNIDPDEHSTPHRQFGGHVASGNPSAQPQSASEALNNPNYLRGLIALSDCAASVSPGDWVRIGAIADSCLALSRHEHPDMDPHLLLFWLQVMKH